MSSGLPWSDSRPMGIGRSWSTAESVSWLWARWSSPSAPRATSGSTPLSAQPLASTTHRATQCWSPSREVSAGLPERLMETSLVQGLSECR